MRLRLRPPAPNECVTRRLDDLRMRQLLAVAERPVVIRGRHRGAEAAQIPGTRMASRLTRIDAAGSWDYATDRQVGACQCTQRTLRHGKASLKHLPHPYDVLEGKLGNACRPDASLEESS